MEPLATLIDVAGLAARLDDPDCAVLDCRFDLVRPAWGREALGGRPRTWRVLLRSRPRSRRSGWPLDGPSSTALPDAFAARAGAWGIDERVQVVVYDQGNGMYAARAWWLFRWLGHRAVAVLDGGFAAWTAAAQPVTTAAGDRAARRFVARIDRSATVDTDALATGLRDAAAGLRLVDARGADRFAGQNETIDPIAGHVPGAVNHPFVRNVDATGRLRPADELRAQWLQTLGGAAPTALVAMCGSGVSACHNLLALEHAGLGGGRLYPGSWSEWIRDPSRPVATGPA